MTWAAECQEEEDFQDVVAEVESHRILLSFTR
jgi:hypothetical protein